MNDRAAYILGAFSTNFGKRVEQGYKSLTREVYLGALADAGLDDGDQIDSAWFGNTTLHTLGQSTIGGQVLFTPLVREGLFPEHVPIVNVSNACATGSSAVRGAYLEVMSGASDLSLAIGVEKLVDPDRSPEATAELFMGGIDRLDPHEWMEYYEDAARTTGSTFVVPKDRSMFMDTYAMQARWHMRQYGTTKEQIAMAAAKTHRFGAQNARAQYRFTMSVEDVLADRVVAEPLTRAMCAPMSDGGAAVLVCSSDYLRQCAPAVRERALRIAAIESSGGKYRALDESGLTRSAASKAYLRAGCDPEDIDLIEVHDATSFSEIFQLEMLSICADGEGGQFIEDGRADLEGDVPVNTSGGLISKGHPIAATGISMLCELAEQLRGEAADRQVANPQLGLAENGGGVIGFDEAVAFVTILAREPSP